MKEIKSIWIWQCLTGLLILCNIGLLATLWIKPGQNPPFPHNPPPTPFASPRDIVIDKLNFTKEQIGKYDDLIKEHINAMDRLRNEGKALREQLFGILKNDNNNLKLKDSLIDLIAINQKQIETVTYNHFEQVKNLCTSSQKIEFGNILNEVLINMNRQGRGGQPPPPPNPVDFKPGNGNFPPPPPPDMPPPSDR